MTFHRILLALALALGSSAHAATLLVANKSEASLSLLSTLDYTEVARLPTGEGPHEVAVSPDGRRALVTDYGTREAAGRTLTLVDIAGAANQATITLPDNARPHGVEWLDNSRAVVTAEGLRQLLVVDVDQQSVVTAITIDQDIAHMVAADTERGLAYTANIGSGTATVADLSTGNKVSDLATGAGAEGIALARGGAELWVTNRSADTVSIIDTESLATLATLPLAGFPIRAEADEARGRVYVTLPSKDALAVMDVASREETARIDFDIGPDRERKTLFSDALPDSSIPIGVLLAGDGEHLYVAHTNAHVISIYRAANLERVAVIAVGLEPDGMAWSPVDVRAATD